MAAERSSNSGSSVKVAVAKTAPFYAAACIHTPSTNTITPMLIPARKTQFPRNAFAEPDFSFAGETFSNHPPPPPPTPSGMYRNENLTSILGTCNNSERIEFRYARCVRGTWTECRSGSRLLICKSMKISMLRGANLK